ncbi:MAG: insulinase family protein [Colwellia sp.]
MKQSPNDYKQYKTITLPNGLRVLLVHNAETRKSAAALAVNAGHFNDPKDRQGLAHFLEHMLFLGTKKYPDGSEYQKFISQYGGCNNAWTATEHTCFFFDIHHQYFQAALDRFSQFFIEPLLSNEFITKERQNIDAEFKLKLKDDIRRLYDVHKETINQAHPFSQFSVGNIDTLADRGSQKIRDDVQGFFAEYYRAEYMTLALEGPQSLTELTSLAQQMFSAIKPANKALTPITKPLYLPENQGIKIDVCPVKNDHQLIISFAMESIDKYYQEKPESILAYLLGHEGTGSILSILKKQQWAMGLTAGSGVNGSNFKDFNISISLTDLGEKHINDIIDVIFSYIGLLKSSSLPKHYYQEKKAIADLSFNYHEKISSIDNVSQLVLNMQHYPPEDYIFGDYIMKGLSEKIISHLLNYLTADNMRVIHVSQNNTFEQTSFWYQVPYQVSTISKEKLQHWQNLATNKQLNEKLNSLLYLPAENIYITGSQHVYDNAEKKSTPEIIEKSTGLAVWYKQDTTFKVPKGYLYLDIDSPFAIANIKNIAMTRLFVDLYTDTVVEEHYDAELAGIHYHLYAHQGGVTLQLSGISENQSLLLTKLLTSLKNHRVSKVHFTLLKQQLIKHWNNTDKSKSISQLFSTLSSMMQPNNPSSDELALALSTVSYEQYQNFCSQLFQQVTLEVLIHGNWLLTHAQNIANTIKKAFVKSYHQDNFVQCPVVDIKNKKTLIYPIDLADHDQATVVYTPLADKKEQTVALTMVISHLLSPLFFQEMRTEKQYGYLVGVGYVPINHYPGIAFYIQSPHTDAISLTIAIDKFINDSIANISNINSEDWQQLKQGLSGQLQERDHSLRIKSQRFWASICNKDEFFTHKQLLISAIQSLKFSQVKDFISKNLMTIANPDRIILLTQQKISVNEKSSTTKAAHLYQQNIFQLKGKIITELNEFTKKNPRKF